MDNVQNIQFSVEHSIAHICLNRPDAANAFDVPMAAEFMRTAQLCESDPSVRAVLISGSGRIFCGGGDLKAFQDAGEEMPRYVNRLITDFHAAISSLTRMNAPVIAAVHGAAGGAGMSLVCAADMVLAAEGTRFTMGYTKAGLTPDGSSTYHLPRIVGVRRALELIQTNRVLTVEEAHDWGIVNRIVESNHLLDEARRLASDFARGPTRVFGESKRLLYTGSEESLETQMRNEARTIVDICMSDDSREGRNAFAAKREARFTGL